MESKALSTTAFAFKLCILSAIERVFQDNSACLGEHGRGRHVYRFAGPQTERLWQLQGVLIIEGGEVSCSF